ARPLDPNSMRQLRSQDLRSMLDRMERLARSGAKDAARQLLEQLQQMLENLQMARPGGDMGDDADDMSSALEELGDMIRKQQQMGQGQGPGQPGRMTRGRANPDTDPLGRDRRSPQGTDPDDATVQVPGEIDIQRARRILEELRRRFGESFRPQLELDYIDRL